MSKRAELLALARLRQATRWSGFKCIGDYEGGAYECDFVSPYTKTAGNINAEIMVMLQDWSSDGSLSKGFDEDSATLGYSRHVVTNQNLIRRLDETFGLTLPDIYATNLFPFIKLGLMNASIPRRDLIRAAHDFAIPQIRIVNPQLVICLGVNTFNALRRVCGASQWLSRASAIEAPFALPGTDTRIWCQAHTGLQGQN